MVKNEKKVSKRSSGKRIILYSIIGLLVLGGIFISVVQLPYTGIVGYVVKEPYTDTEYYYEKEPYTTQECNKENMLYKIDYTTIRNDCISDECSSYNSVCAQYQDICERTESVCVDTNFWGNCIEYEDRCIDYGQQCVRYSDVCAGTKCTKYQKYCSLTITNKEREGATFSLKLLKYDYDDKSSTTIKSDSLYVNGLDSNTIYWNYAFVPTESTTCWYSLESTPQKSVCSNVIKYRDVQKSRTVTKYKDEYKERTETLYATPLEQITGNAVGYRKE